MDLYPEDLGETISREILRLRKPKFAEAPTVSLQTLGGISIGSLIATLVSGLLHWPIALLFLLVTVVSALMYASTAMKSHREQGAKIGCVTDYEITQVRNNFRTQDPLLRAYLKLALAIMAAPGGLETSTEREIRSAVCALATTIESLPPAQQDAPVRPERASLAERLEQADDNHTETPPDDPEALQAEADRLSQRAQAEADPVIRASLQRRAESQKQRAETAAQTLMLLRRNQALRDEVAEQISALRTNLAAFSVGGKQSAQDFAGLAASIQRVTVEANAITEARAEIDTLLAESARTVVNDEAQEQPLRVR